MQQRSAATTLTATVAATETNQAVETAFGGAITTDNLNIIKNNIKITYISAALRYLNKMDSDLTGTVSEHREHQGEGHSFWLTALVAGHAGSAEVVR